MLKRNLEAIYLRAEEMAREGREIPYLAIDEDLSPWFWSDPETDFWEQLLNQIGG